MATYADHPEIPEALENLLKEGVSTVFLKDVTSKTLYADLSGIH